MKVKTMQNMKMYPLFLRRKPKHVARFRGPMVAMRLGVAFSGSERKALGSRYGNEESLNAGCQTAYNSLFGFISSFPFMENVTLVYLERYSLGFPSA